MSIVDIIIKKRDGGELSQGEIEAFIGSYVAGEVPDYQAAAWLMAVYLRGMTPPETTRLTEVMAFSGERLDLHDVARFCVDKHSSGGVGDKTTLVSGPVVASLGVPVGKMSGRGLAFSGGTLDKLEAIPGLQVTLRIERFKRQLAEIGLVIAGQTHELAPADGKLYALRDVTGTVTSLPLIASSIMSKKIAAGADAIVLDVKVGAGRVHEHGRRGGRAGGADGADRARAGATHDGADRRHEPAAGAGRWAMRWRCARRSRPCTGAGRRTSGSTASTWRARCCLIAGAAASPEAGRAQAAATLADGSAWAKFRQFVAAQGGEVAAVDEPGRLPQAPVVLPLPAARDGFVAGLDAGEVGRTVVDLGGGRLKKGDAVDPAVGVVLAPEGKVGGRVTAGQALLWVHARSEEAARAALARLAGAYRLADERVAPPPLIHRIIRSGSPEPVQG